MPEYVYQCGSCGWKFKAFHSIQNVPRLRCEYCGSTNVFRIPQPFAYHVKVMDSGQRKAKEISEYLMSKRDKARAEAEEYTYRKETEHGRAAKE